MKKRIITLSLLSLFSFCLLSCGNNDKKEDKSNITSGENTKITQESDNISDTTTITTTKTDEQKRQELIDNSYNAINSLSNSNNNFTAKIGNDIYKVDGNNIIINDKIYEFKDNKYYLYELKDETEQSYTKNEITDLSFKNINVGSWNSIFTIKDQMKVDSVDIDKNEAYIAKKETSVPLFKISYTDNGFKLTGEEDSIEFYNIGNTEITLPTNIVKDEYIIKDGKYDLVSLKAVLNDWMNGNNKDNSKILEAKASRTFVDIKLINVEDGALTLYTQGAAQSGNNYLGKIFFLSDDINNEIVKDNLKLDDFTPILYEQNIVNISYSSVLKIDEQFVLDVEDRASNALAKDGINEDIVWAFETDKLSSNLTYGAGLTYRMVCFTSCGNYYEYEINALSKDRVLENDTPKFDVEQERKVSVLTENLDLYE